jgi:hypothetical protein
LIPAIFSTDPAIRLSQPPKSGKSISARIRPANPEEMDVGKESKKAQNGDYFELHFVGSMRDALGQSVQPKEHDAEHQNGGDENCGHYHHENVCFARARDERRQMMGSSRVKRGTHNAPPIEDAGLGFSALQAPVNRFFRAEACRTQSVSAIVSEAAPRPNPGSRSSASRAAVRAHRERPRGHRAADQGDEVPSPHAGTQERASDPGYVAYWYDT